MNVGLSACLAPEEADELFSQELRDACAPAALRFGQVTQRTADGDGRLLHEPVVEGRVKEPEVRELHVLDNAAALGVDAHRGDAEAPLRDALPELHCGAEEGAALPVTIISNPFGRFSSVLTTSLISNNPNSKTGFNSSSTKTE